VIYEFVFCIIGLKFPEFENNVVKFQIVRKQKKCKIRKLNEMGQKILFTITLTPLNFIEYCQCLFNYGKQRNILLNSAKKNLRNLDFSSKRAS
jgi:hypothetical protein